MTFRWLNISALLLSASTAFAGWDGFPCQSNVSWYAVETNHYWAQLMTGLVERCKASGVAAPAIVDTYTNLFAGYTNTYTATNGYIVTNNWICYTNATVTNQFLPFAYSWSQTNGTSGTATCYPAIKQSWIAAWDSKFASLFSAYWIDTYSTGILTNRSYITNWYASNVAHLPRETRTNIFLRNGIGSGTNWGGRFTHTPDLLTNEWSLGAVRKTTNSATSWSYQEMTPITTNIHDASIRPVFEYWPSVPPSQTLATSFNGSSVVFTITGTILNFTSQSATSGTEIITITDSNDVATVQPWYRITGITSTNVPPNSNDAWRVVYKESFPIYGGNPYLLYACDINERMMAISPLVACIYSGYPSAATFKHGESSLGSIYGWDARKIEAREHYDDGTYGTALYWVGTTLYDTGPRYKAIITGWSVTDPLVVMPAAMTNVTIEMWKFFNVSADPHSGEAPYNTPTTNFFSFGVLPSGTVTGNNFIASGTSYGPVVTSGTWGTYDADIITNPWCAIPITGTYEGLGFRVEEWHMTAIHTNWMQKY